MPFGETQVKIPGLGDDDDVVKDADSSKYRYNGAPDFSQDFSEDVAEVYWGGGSGSNTSKDIIQDMGVTKFPGKSDFQDMGTTKFPSKRDIQDVAGSKFPGKRDIQDVATSKFPDQPFERPKPPPFVPTKEYLERLEVVKKEHSIERGPFVNSQGETEENKFLYFCKYCQCKLYNMGIVEAHVIGQRHLKSLQKFKPIPEVKNSDILKAREGIPYVSEMQRLTAKIKRPLVGLSEVIEYQNKENPRALPFYSCVLCKSSHTYDKLLSHVEGTKHQMFYLKSIEDPTYYSLRNCTAQKLRFQLNKKLSSMKGLTENMQMRSLPASEYNHRKTRVESNSNKRSADDDLFIPTKKIKADTNEVVPTGPQKTNQFQGPQKTNQFQGPRNPKFQDNRNTKFQDNRNQKFQGNRNQTFQGNRNQTFQGQQNPMFQGNQNQTFQGNQNPTFQGNRPIFNSPPQYGGPNPGALMLRGPNMGPSPRGNAPYYNPQAASGGNMVSTTTPSFSTGGALAPYDREFLQSLSQRAIETDDDAQLLMNTVNSLTQNLVQYKIKKMPPQLKETLLMTAMWGGSDALASLMEVQNSSSQNKN